MKAIFLLTLQMTFCKIRAFRVYEVVSEVVKFQLVPLLKNLVKKPLSTVEVYIPEDRQSVSSQGKLPSTSEKAKLSD
jgi:hypothetical protein